MSQFRVSPQRLLLAVASAILPVGCYATQTGRAISATASFSAYTHSSLADSGHGSSVASEPSLLFPELRVYDSQGQLVYRHAGTFEANSETASIIEGLPDSLYGKKPIIGAPSLPVLAAALSGMSSADQGLLRKPQPAVVLLSLDHCKACTLQEEESTDWQPRLLAHGFTLLRLEITREHP